VGGIKVLLIFIFKLHPFQPTKYWKSLSNEQRTTKKINMGCEIVT